jgi:hypothetical protein
MTNSATTTSKATAAMAPGDSVTYLGYPATVVHVFTTTANIRFTGRTGGMSRQLDAPITAIVPAT